MAKRYYLYTLKMYNKTFGTNWKITQFKVPINAITINNQHLIPCNNTHHMPDLQATIDAILQDFPAILDQDDMRNIFNRRNVLSITKYITPLVVHLEEQYNYLRSDVIQLLQDHYYLSDT